MKLKKILPFLVIGIAGIVQGETENLILSNQNTDKMDIENIEEQMNTSSSVSDISSNTTEQNIVDNTMDFKTTSKTENFKIKNKKNSENENLFQINIEYMGGFSKNKSSNDNIVKNQSVIMPAFRWTGNSGVYAQFWNGITEQGKGLISEVAFGSYVGTHWSTQELVRRDEDLQQMIKNNEAGIKNIGYTYTSHQTRNIDLVYKDIDNFINYYGRENIQGYFIDVINSAPRGNNIEYMKNVYNYIKTKYPEMIVIANDGWGVSDEISPYADVWMSQEVSADEYINRYRERTSEFEKNPENSGKILHVIVDATPEQYEEIIRLSRERNAGNLFITTDTHSYPSGYDDLPTYFEDLMMTINKFTPTVGSLFSSENQALDKVKVEMPRSKVDLDLTKSLRNTGYKNMEHTKDKQYKIDIAYMGNYGGKYEDRKSNVKYNSDSDGAFLNISKDFGKFTIGGAFGHQKSDIKYKEKYDGVKEKIKSYQFGINGKYDFNENIDVMASLIYSTNKHEFKTDNNLGAISGAEYKSKIIDLNSRVGYKFLLEKGYIKPYIGLGITKVNEEKIDKLYFSDSKKTHMNGSIGVYAEKSLGKFDLFGELEYEQRFNNKTYHGARKRSERYEIAPLNYSSGTVNTEVGVRYNISNKFEIKASYELRESKNSLVKASFGAKF